jgi:hypothetical protein
MMSLSLFVPSCLLLALCLIDAGLLQSATVLSTRFSAGRSSFARPVASMPLASPPVIPPAAHGESVDLYCDRDGHVDVFCYKKKKANKVQTHTHHQFYPSKRSVVDPS